MRGQRWEKGLHQCQLDVAQKKYILLHFKAFHTPFADASVACASQSYIKCQKYVLFFCRNDTIRFNSMLKPFSLAHADPWLKTSVVLLFALYQFFLSALFFIQQK